MLSAVTVRDAWCQILNWTGPSSEAKTLFLERQLEAVPNYGDEDPKLFFSRVDQLLTRLRSIDVHKAEKQIVNILVRNLSDHYEIEKRSRLAPFLRRRDVEHIVSPSWATRQMRQLEQRSASEVTPNPHALVASGVIQTTRGRYGGPRRGMVDRVEVDVEYSSPGLSTAVPTPEGGLTRNRRLRPTARRPTVNGAVERTTWPGSAGHRRDSKGSATLVASTAIGCVTAFETNLPRTLTSLPPL